MNATNKPPAWENPLPRLVKRLAEHKEHRLAYGGLWSDVNECPCALGAMLPKPVLKGIIREGSMRNGSLLDYAPTVVWDETDLLVKNIRQWLDTTGLSVRVIERIEALNDVNPRESATARYTRMLEELTSASKLNEVAFDQWVYGPGGETDE